MKGSVLITGAAGGLGIHVTSYFSQQNWNVIAVVRDQDEQQKLTHVQQCRTLVCDVTDDDAVEQLRQQLPSSLDAVVHLVGGIAGVANIEQTETDDFTLLWQLNALSTYLVLRATMPLLKQNAGAFIAIGARTVLHTEPRKALYAATKAAVLHLILTAAEEGRPHGMRANIIMPSIIRTPANLDWATDDEDRDWVEPGDIARCIHMLCSQEGRSITGAVIPMYGKIPA